MNKRKKMINNFFIIFIVIENCFFYANNVIKNLEIKLIKIIKMLKQYLNHFNKPMDFILIKKIRYKMEKFI